MDITLLIATIGCITGLSSLLIQFFSFLSTVPRLKIAIDESSHSYFFRAEDFKVERYRTKFCAVVSLIISNKSSYPVTIDGIYIKSNKLKGCRIKHINEFSFQPKSIPLGEKTWTEYCPSKSIVLPFRIDAFDTIFVSARFPFFDKLVDTEDLSKPAEFDIVVSTPRKTFRHKVKLYEYMYYHDLRRKPRNK